jgi:hypothetical protein
MRSSRETATILVLIGFAVGAFGTLIGPGGGFILNPLLLLLYPPDSPQTLTAISLATVFFNAASGSRSRITKANDGRPPTRRSSRAAATNRGADRNYRDRCTSGSGPSRLNGEQPTRASSARL